MFTTQVLGRRAWDFEQILACALPRREVNSGRLWLATSTGTQPALADHITSDHKSSPRNNMTARGKMTL